MTRSAELTRKCSVRLANSMLFTAAEEVWKEARTTSSGENTRILPGVGAFIIIIMVLFYLFIQYYAVLKEISIR